ncbi:MAG TPA: YolD-like family protein [Metabacillus sp.]|nr:YolD-like family protein [Metabacillus sp.]
MIRVYDKTSDTVEKPILDTHQLDEINQIIYEAMENNKELVFTYFEKGGMRLYVGKNHYIDLFKQELRLMDLHGDIFYLKHRDILRVDFHE